jgi:hypothetical protein
VDSQEKKALENIENYGCHVLLVMAEGELPRFAYSVGIEKTCGLPEVILIGLKDKLAHSMINNYCRRVRAGESFEDGKFYPDFIEGFDVQVRKVHPSWYREYFGWCRWLYKGDDFQVIQLVYPTTAGVWPWDEGAPEAFLKGQPLLDAPKLPKK